jgi:hypothetical protein
MSIGAGQAAWKLAYQISPIILNNGIAQNVPGGMLPIISITEALNFTVGILSGGENIELDDFFANYQPIPGGTLIDQDIGEYPFANQSVAANAVIAKPLKIPMLMICPVRESLGYFTKTATMLAFQQALQQHNQSGGTYTIVTPSAFYANCVMRGMTDVTAGDSKQVQWMWRLDFEQPLLTLAQAQQAENSMMNKITNGTQTDGSLSGLQPTVGSPASLAVGGVVSAASTSGAGTVAQAVPGGS